MALCSLRDIAKSFGEVEILSGVSMQLEREDKAGLVGANGSGKTTLLKVIMGLEKQDKGEVLTARNLSTGYLSQRPEIRAGITLGNYLERAAGDIVQLQEMLAALELQMASTAARENPDLQNDLLDRYSKLSQHFEQQGGYSAEHRVGEVAYGLGFKKEDFTRLVEGFSGGEKTRVQLASLLLQEHDLLLLDEPTNNLDADAITWLENYLASWRGALLVVSHDRFFLDRVAGKIFHLENRQVKTYRGNYTAFAAQRELEQRSESREYERRRVFWEKEKRFIQNARADERTKRQARSREKRLEKTQPVPAAPGSSQTMGLGFDFAGRSGDIVVSLENAGKAYGSKKILGGVNLEIRWGDRIAVVGPNGSGKSTLLKLITGEEPCTEGGVWLGPSVQLAYYDQDQGQLDPESTLVESIMETSGMMEREARHYLGRYLFRGDEVFKKIREISGGEKSRLALARTALGKNNFLILDEPTNHLDISGMEKLEATLVDYPGTLLLVSHDRYFVSRIATKIIEVRKGCATLFNESYPQYLERRARRQDDVVSGNSTAPGQARSARKEQREREKIERQRTLAKKREQRRVMQYVDELESLVQQAEKQVEALEVQLAEPAVYDDFEQARIIMGELQEARMQMQELIKAWEEAAEKLENMTL